MAGKLLLSLVGISRVKKPDRRLIVVSALKVKVKEYIEDPRKMLLAN
jgi:hypothetical protein